MSESKGTLIRVEGADSYQWHHSVEFDGVEGVHETACGMEVDTDRISTVEMDIEEWGNLDSRRCCNDCGESVQSMIPRKRDEEMGVEEIEERLEELKEREAKAEAFHDTLSEVTALLDELAANPTADDDLAAKIDLIQNMLQLSVHEEHNVGVAIHHEREVLRRRRFELENKEVEVRDD